MISRKKPVYLRFNGDWNLDGNSDINLQGENLESVNCIRNFFPLSAMLLDELWFVMFCQCLGPFKWYVTLFFWKLDPHPPPRNANNIEHYTFVTLFSRKSDTPHPHLRYVTLEWPLM